MSMTKVVETQRDEWVRSARLLGEGLSRRAFGERGPDWNVTLEDLEQFLRPLIATRAGGFLAESASEQTQRLAETLPCPSCGRECSRKEHERTLPAAERPFTWSEPACHCEYFDGDGSVTELSAK